jgi:hypothetical protein
MVSVNKYRSETLGRADDVADADGIHVLSHPQADAAARAKVNAPAAKVHRVTVRKAMELYADYKRTEGKSVDKRVAVHILPVLGDLVVEELTAPILRRWLATLAATPAQTRPKAGQPTYREEAVTDEDIRRRRSSANRVLTLLKAR